MTKTERMQAGRLLGSRYMLLTLIAKGGMGEVWKARDRETGRLLAAKVLKTELSGQELSLSRLRLEASNAMRINHPNVASVYDSGEENGCGWIIMEFVDSHPLTHYLANGNRIPAADLLPVLMQIAMALTAAEKAGVVHRDIKPANVLVRDDGVVKITDFGISRSTDQVSLTAEGMVMGTAQYLPPEQAMGRQATPSGDLYALGVIAYEALVGRRPFTGKNQVDIAFSHVNDAVPPMPDDIPAPVAAVVMHLLDKDPQRRPANGMALARELMAAANDLNVDLQPRPLSHPTAADEVTAPTAAQPVIPPVAHVKRSRIPEDLVSPLDFDERLRFDAPSPKPRTESNTGQHPQWRSRSQTSGAVPHRRRTETHDTFAVSTRHAGSSQDTSAVRDAPLSRRYNRSTVAPKENFMGRIGAWIIVALFILTLILIAVSAIYNRLGLREVAIDSTAVTIEEVSPWLSQ